MSKAKGKGDDILNFYAHKDMKKYITTYHNPRFADTQINIPARIGVIAASGGGKTQFLLNFISKTSDTFGHIWSHCMSFYETRWGQNKLLFIPN